MGVSLRADRALGKDATSLDEILDTRIEAASRDQSGEQMRRELGESVAKSLRAAGQMLWMDGAIVGPDRASGKSPFDFGNDATVGLATVLQIAGELVGGAVALLAVENRYAAAALVRQLVEVEYLAWAFAEDQEEATNWMRSTKKERHHFWRPSHIRERAGGRFRGTDYADHCGKGGHPSPEGIYLLPDHYRPDASTAVWWCDLVIHGTSVWRYASAAAASLGHGEVFTSLAETEGLSEAERRWRESDPFMPIMDELRRHQSPGPLATLLVELRKDREGTRKQS